jgi:hypothetical protein
MRSFVYYTASPQARNEFSHLTRLYHKGRKCKGNLHSPASFPHHLRQNVVEGALSSRATMRAYVKVGLYRSSPATSPKSSRRSKPGPFIHTPPWCSPQYDQNKSLVER